MNHFLKVCSLFLASLTFCSSDVIGQDTLSHNAKISLLTCEPASEIYTLFGHSAFWVFDPVNRINQVYNYGTFDSNAPNFIINFLKGKMLYSVGVQDGGNFIYKYNHYKIGIHENELNLNPYDKNRLYQVLVTNALPENREYLYDFYFDNCSNKLGIILEDLFGPYDISAKSDKTFRDLLHEYLNGLDWTRFGIDLIIGSDSDRPATTREQMFLPDYLQNNLLLSQTPKSQPVLKETKTIIDYKRPKHRSFWITPIVLFTLFLLLEILILRYGWTNKWVVALDYMWIALMTIASVIIAFMWLGTDHEACTNNYNIVAFSPLIIIWLILKLLNFKWLKWISLLVVAPYILLPFIKMSVQNLPSAVMLIALITLLKIIRLGEVKGFRKWV